MTNTQIKQELQKARDLKELKSIMRKLSKLVHPDLGGDTEQMQYLNEIYNKALENFIYFTSTGTAEETEININVEKIIRDLLHLEDIEIEICGSWIWVKGETKQHKETLKKSGFRWSKNKKEWYNNQLDPNKDKKRFRGTSSKDEIIAKYGATKIATNQQTKIAA